MVWEDQSRWSQAANTVKSRVERVRWATLGLGVIGAVLGTTSAQLADQNPDLAQVFALISAICLAAVAWLTKQSGANELRHWIGLRAVSEQLKAELYTYLAGVAPYRGPDAAERLLQRTASATDAIGRLGSHTGGIEPVQRPVPEVEDVASYIKQRVLRQINGYYRPKAAHLHRRLAWARWTEATLSAFGALLGVVATFGYTPQASAWLAVLTTVSGAVAVHVTASRWQYHEIEYQRTAAQLERLIARRLERTEARSDGTFDSEDDAFVAECERVISIENEGWMARWSLPPSTGPWHAGCTEPHGTTNPTSEPSTSPALGEYE